MEAGQRKGFGLALPWGAWFGPIGVSALFYVTLLNQEHESGRAWPVVAAIVAVSVIVFGMSATPLARCLGRLSRAEGPAD